MSADAIFERNGRAEPWKNQMIGTPEQVLEVMRPFLGIGFRHFIVGFPAPYDAKTMVRLISEVKPELERS